MLGVGSTIVELDVVVRDEVDVADCVVDDWACESADAAPPRIVDAKAQTVLRPDAYGFTLV